MVNNRVEIRPLQIGVNLRDALVGTRPAVVRPEELSPEAIEKALDALGIRGRVVIQPYTTRELVSAGQLVGYNAETDTWTIQLNMSRRGEPGLSYTLWHELAHAQDAQKQMDARGVTFEQLLEELEPRAREAYLKQDAIAYNSMREEVYANLVAEDHLGELLTVAA